MRFENSSVLVAYLIKGSACANGSLGWLFGLEESKTSGPKLLPLSVSGFPPRRLRSRRVFFLSEQLYIGVALPFMPSKSRIV